MKRIFILSLSIFFIMDAYAKAPEDLSDSSEQGPPSIGNFIFSEASQQPGPLMGFGENIIDPQQTVLYFTADEFYGPNMRTVDTMPSFVYGITDKFSVFFELPIAASYQAQQNHASGFEDMILQFEYAVYAHQTKSYTDQATVVSNITFPTGSSTSSPLTGAGSPTFFEGTTFNRTYINWFLFTSYGAILTTENDSTRIGNQYLYQGGFGRNLFDIGSKWIFAWILEGTGQYTEKNKISGVIDNDSGGNIVYVTPSIWISSQTLIFQFGVGLPAEQHWFGEQTKTNYALNLNMGWSF